MECVLCGKKMLQEHCAHPGNHPTLPFPLP